MHNLVNLGSVDGLHLQDLHEEDVLREAQSDSSYIYMQFYTKPLKEPQSFKSIVMYTVEWIYDL